jgi:signal transduction histidine kinase
MTGQTSDFLSAHSERIADTWKRAVGVSAEAPGRGARAFMSAILIALTADDLGPLVAYYELDPGSAAGADERLSLALQQIQALFPAMEAAAAEDGMPVQARLELALSANEELGLMRIRLVTATVSGLLDQLISSRTTSSSRGTSLAITMHELRRPLTILSSYAQLLSSGMLGSLPESASVAVEGITSSTEMMVRLVNALSELSRLEDPDDKLTIEPLSLDEIVTAAMEPMSTEAKFRDSSVEIDVAGGKTVQGDKRRLTLALTNILSNALKHSPTGGTVSLRAWIDDSGAHFLVADQGPGFPPEDAGHLFEKYFRSTAERHRKIPGSGLGLYIVKTVAQRHGGDVLARSEPGQGAEFEIVIPVAQQ